MPFQNLANDIGLLIRRNCVGDINPRRREAPIKQNGTNKAQLASYHVRKRGRYVGVRRIVAWGVVGKPAGGEEGMTVGASGAEDREGLFFRLDLIRCLLSVPPRALTEVKRRQGKPAVRKSASAGCGHQRKMGQ